MNRENSTRGRLWAIGAAVAVVLAGVLGRAFARSAPLWTLIVLVGLGLIAVLVAYVVGVGGSDAEPGKGRWIALNVVLLVIVLGALGLGGYSGWKLASAQEDDSGHADALAAARQHVDGFMTTSAGSVDADLDRIEAASTGEFKEQWVKQEPGLRESIVANQATSNGDVLSAAVVYDNPNFPTDRDSVGVIAAADATVTNVNAPEGRLVHYRVIVEMSLVDGKWLIGKLEFVA